jgi:hypothetical protein
MTKAEKDKTNFVIETNVFKVTGIRYFCVYTSNKSKLLLLTRSIKEVSSFTGVEYGYWRVNR